MHEKVLSFFLYSLPLTFLFVLSQPREAPFLNADRVKRKLPSLLVDESTTERKSWNTLMRYRYWFTQFKKRQPEKFNSITSRILLDLIDLEKVVNESNNTDRRHKA
jgi:hypothetical protein